MTLPPNVAPQDSVVLFDGVCKLCAAWSNFIIQNDSEYQIKLCSVQSIEGQKILHHFGHSTEHFETMLFVRGGQCFEKSQAFFEVISLLGWPWKSLTIFRFIPRTLRDWLYDRIALNRYRLFGKYEYCRLPEADHEDRFVVETKP